jgi:nitrous oxide reductase
MDKVNRREFLKSSAAVLGSVAVSEGISSIVSKNSSATEAAEPSPAYEIYALKYAGLLQARWQCFSGMKGGTKRLIGITISG